MLAWASVSAPVCVPSHTLLWFLSFQIAQSSLVILLYLAQPLDGIDNSLDESCIASNALADSLNLRPDIRDLIEFRQQECGLLILDPILTFSSLIDGIGQPCREYDKGNIEDD